MKEIETVDTGHRAFFTNEHSSRIITNVGFFLAIFYNVPSFAIYYVLLAAH